MNPKVTIIMATYNRAHFIAETLYAIQNQTFTDWECLIIDDGGTDDAKEIINPILKNDKRFKYYLRSDDYKKGPSGCRNFGLKIANGYLISFFDDDDIPHPQNLELCVSELSDNREIYFCRYGRSVFFEDFHYNYDFSKKYDQSVINKNDVYKILTNELQIITTSVMWKKECFKEDNFVPHLIYGEEWELYSRIISSGYNGITIDKVLFFARKHRNSLTGEFGNNNPLHRNSYNDAMILALENLQKKKMLNYFIIRYFIVISYNYQEYNLFNRIIYALKLSFIKELQWRIFFYSLKVRLPINRISAKRKKDKLIQKI